MYASSPQTHTVADPSGRGLADRAGWRNREKRGDKGSAAWFSQWCTQHTANRLVLSRPTKNVLERVSCFQRGQDDAICERRLRPLNIPLLPSRVIPLFGHHTTSIKN